VFSHNENARLLKEVRDEKSESKAEEIDLGNVMHQRFSHAIDLSHCFHLVTKSCIGVSLAQ
jgi:hypothetical protein